MICHLTVRVLRDSSSPALLLPGHLHVDDDGGHSALRGAGESVCENTGEEVHCRLHSCQLW